LIKTRTPIFSPTGEAMRMEREGDFVGKLCAEFNIPLPKAFVASNRREAEKIIMQPPKPFVIKNPLSSPTGPVHTNLCETADDPRAWLAQRQLCRGRVPPGISDAPRPGTSPS
jgi:phosphoribosylamine--glycine ligase